MSAEFTARILGALAFAIGGGYLGVILSGSADAGPAGLWASVFALVGALTGLVLTPLITTRPFLAIRRQLAALSARSMMVGLVGLTVGLVIAALLSQPISLLPSPFGQLLPFVGALLFAYLGASSFVLRQNDIVSLWRSRPWGAEDTPLESPGRQMLLDTSVIIDGRIADIARTEFISGPLLVPAFILQELQGIADSSDSLRRQRGRRGLDILNQLQKDKRVPMTVSDLDIEGVRSVDDKLVILARQLRCPIVTNDYNLNRVAELQGVTVLNINELANAVKAVFLPGEKLEVQVIQEGKEIGQGVGYLDDGTMVVVEEGKSHVGRIVPVMVTKVLQTAAGRMIFAKPEGNHHGA